MQSQITLPCWARELAQPGIEMFEPAELRFIIRPQLQCAECRRQCQRDQTQDFNRYGNRDRELTVHHGAHAAHEGDRHEHGARFLAEGP